MKNLVYFVGVILFSQSLYSGNESRGGGGPSRNGKKQTFYEAGFYTEPEPSTEEDLPVLNELMTRIQNMPFLPVTVKAAYIQALLPSNQRRYFKVLEKDFSSETLDRLLDVYSRITKVPKGELNLYAITDTNVKVTYLLPSMKDLKPLGQMAIFFHEADWLLNPDATYEEILSAEIAFQAVLEKPTPLRILKFLDAIGADDLDFLVEQDRKNKVFGASRYGKDGIPFVDLLGQGFFECVSSPDSWHSKVDCRSLISLQVRNLRTLYPKSLILKKFEENFASGQIRDPLEAFGKMDKLHLVQTNMKTWTLTDRSYLTDTILLSSCRIKIAPPDAGNSESLVMWCELKRPVIGPGMGKFYFRI